ncbi:hypothetical protein OHS33_01680 [Streptomyces sp. NBC_00536]|uniref:hypothetical protein n=1 Tax=Streptomyces sp. NBC_00536 TaxID=2975769 RepID=UPI002E80446B|nr:hypothetical protein [Streptomyces sp. NBC_00536]WUC77172.1 hypothetical protein OHS33_01680 [Streptomyces sp. NBC_00536]
MTFSAHISHDAVLRARVALLGSGKPLLAERVAAYRILARVSPLAYLPLLAGALRKYGAREFAHEPAIQLALLAESVAAAREMYAREPGRAGLLIDALRAYGGQLARMERRAEARAADEEITRLVAGEG